MPLPPEQDRWLANNAYSIAQASFYADWRTRAIYHDGAPAGFLFYDGASRDEAGQYGIYRFMVEHPKQGRRIGRRACAVSIVRFVQVGVDELGEMIGEIRLAGAETVAQAS